MCSYFFSFNEFAQLSVGPPWLAGRTFVVLLIKAAFTEADPASSGWLNRTFCVREVRRGEGLCLFYLFFFFNEFAQVSGHRGWPAKQFFFFFADQGVIHRCRSCVFGWVEPRHFFFSKFLYLTAKPNLALPLKYKKFVPENFTTKKKKKG